MSYKSKRKQNLAERKIGIVGGAIDPDELFDRAQGFELWGVNGIFARDVPYSRMYELHDIRRRGTYFRRGYGHYPPGSDRTVYEYLKDLDAIGYPVYMQKEWKWIKNSRRFPVEKVMRAYGHYFGCSFAWMIAHALLEGVKELGFFGVALMGNEYYYQRPSTEYMIGLARGQGVSIHLDMSSDLLKGEYLYAYGEDPGKIYMLHGKLCRLVVGTIVGAVSQSYDMLTAQRDMNIEWDEAAFEREGIE